MAKLAREAGGFVTSSTGPLMRAQVQVVGVSDPYGARLSILKHRDELIDMANARDKVLIGLGGCRDIEVHVFPDTPRGVMIVAHLIVDVRDAMGANTVNTMAETVATRIEEITGGKVRLRILSNLADLRLARAQVRYSAATLQTREYTSEDVITGVTGVVDAYLFAAIDLYRAATHNKGIMNGIDPVIVATGNDWRAVEAGAHAYASRGGRYTSLTTWEVANNGDLVGTIEMPMPVGFVGGATKTHPVSRLALKIMDVSSAQELGEIAVAVAVGLAQNMGALRALSTEGIQRGHMALHARNIALAAGASGADIDWVVRKMVAARNVSVDYGMSLLQGPRDGLQNEPSPVSAQVKAELIERLTDAGVRYVEAASFVSPKWVPQMADDAQVLERVADKARTSGTTLAALVPNMKGLDAALASRVDEIAVFAAAREANVRIVAVARRGDENAQAFAEANGIGAWFGSYEALLASPDIDAVYIPLPNSLHAQWAIEVAWHGKHILCEKSLALGRDKAERMFDVADRHGVMLLEAFLYYSQSQTAAMMSVIGEGAIGAVRSVQASFGFTVGNRGANIRMKLELGDGALLDVGSYALSLVRLVMGTAPQSVQAVATWAETDVDISMMATLIYADGRLRIARREEQLRKNERRCLGIDEEVVILERRADPAA